MAGTIRIKDTVTVKYQPNLGEEVSEIELEAGTTLNVLKKWESAWLVKDDEGRLINVKKHLAEEA